MLMGEAGGLMTQARKLTWCDLNQSQVDDLNGFSSRPQLSECVLPPSLDLA
jgi:hypothetical protein